MRRMNLHRHATLATIMLAGLLAGSVSAEPLKKARLFMELPDKCNTPDGATLAPDGSIILSCPNYNDANYPGILVRITKDNRLEEFFKLPAHPQTGKVGPMGLDFGPDGHLYVADNQCFNTTLYKSRLLRVRIENGKPVGCDVAVYGFKVANAVIWRGDYVYVSDSVQDVEWPVSESHFASCIYRFHIKEFGDKPLELKPAGQDPHCIARIYCRSRSFAFAADGLTFDDEGNLYCGCFGDGLMYKITFDADGNVASNTVFAEDPTMACCDGIFYDAKRKVIYVSDSILNAVHRVDLKGKVTTLARNGDTDGADGGIDQVCEVLVRGDELIIVNMDFPFPGLTNTAFDKPYTLSVVKLD